MTNSPSSAQNPRICRFNGSNIKAILEFLRSYETSEIQELICEESISDDDVNELESLLVDYHCFIHLSNLELRNNGLTSVSCRSLASILSIQHETLLSLNLSHNPIAYDGINELIKPLSQSTSTNLIHLDLANTQLGRKGGESIARLLRNNTTVQQLNLTNNLLGTKGIQSIAPELKINSSLLVLNLSYNKIKAKGANYLAQALGQSTQSNLKNLS